MRRCNPWHPKTPEGERTGGNKLLAEGTAEARDRQEEVDA